MEKWIERFQRHVNLMLYIYHQSTQFYEITLAIVKKFAKVEIRPRRT